MKRQPPSQASSSSSDKKIRVSTSEIRTLIEQEIHMTIKKNETKLQGLIETIQQLDCGVDYESSIRKLEAKIDTVAKRAEAALAYMTKTEKKSSLPSLVNVDIIKTDSGGGKIETVKQNDESKDCMDKGGKLFQMMETTKKALKKMRSNNEALTAAITELSEESPPPVFDSIGSPNIKKETEDEQHKQNTEEFEEPKAKRVKVECLSPGSSNIPKHTDSQEPKEKLSYPPLPSTTFPSTLDDEADSYNIPQRLEVHLALIKDPPGLSVLWKVEKEDPNAPPMDSYSVYLTTEKVKGSGVFPAWKIIGEVRAIDLPMCVLINRYKLGHKLCVAVIGKDIFGRYGPYSKVVTAAIPD
ncbi:activating transcription factor 7-interacting protein 2 isoform X2 [Anabas testudineus]|nr:activating transcription factor 7-interacting protein 2 isoform X2 [Anabas testudineus]XP_026217563.1 activating transcription factor 7-interacting protein 2 isoform X2 [Anabas testudineus]XP_026217570.1 activating transcription factor 7-interacting protein 2 isoform X2 [Anabas testudineus]